MPHTHRRAFRSPALWILGILFISILAGGCANSRKVTYFLDVPDTLAQPLAVQHATFEEPRIQPNDLLQVSIQTIDPTTTSILSATTTSMSGSSAPAGGQPSSGIMVDRNGEIELPLVGRVKLGGLTTTEARNLIRDKVAKYYKDPVVNVRLTNFEVSVLGEVARPSKYVINNEKATVLDVIALAGDLTITGKRENVMLIREENGKKVFTRFDLNNTDMLSSPYFYLKTGDVVYVSPNKARSRTAVTDFTRDRYISFGATALSLLVTFIALFITR